MISAVCNLIFDKSIQDYHLTDQVDAPINNPYPENSIDYLLYAKNWIDTVQWHLEDMVRNPQIDPVTGLAVKKRIDVSNQIRTDMVENIDDFFLHQYAAVKPVEKARINTESPAWAIDRLSIIALKIYHMTVEVNRTDAGEAHIKACVDKLAILSAQKKDLSTAIDELLQDIASGVKYMKVYKQMKMYNDPGLNPVLYQLQPK